jgi:hypothetical protein
MNRSTPSTESTQAPPEAVATIDYIIGPGESGRGSDGLPQDDLPVVSGRQPERADRYDNDPDRARLDRDDPFAIPICRGL